MLKQFTSQPIWSLSTFLGMAIWIWIAGKFYSPTIFNAQTYSGGNISLVRNGELVVAEGVVVKSGSSRQGISFLTVKGEQGEFGVTFFPSLGRLSSIPRVGDSIIVTGLLGTYQSKIQVSPLSSQSISLKKSSNINTPSKEASDAFPTVSIEQLSDYIDQTVWVENLKVLSAEQFVSKRGIQMLRFETVDKSGKTISGVFFEGDWDESTLEVLKSGTEVKILAKVSTFRENLSLNGKQVKSN